MSKSDSPPFISNKIEQNTRPKYKKIKKYEQYDDDPGIENGGLLINMDTKFDRLTHVIPT